MKNPLLGHRYPRWMSQNLYWALTALVAVILLFPQTYLGKASSFFLLGALLLGGLAWVLLAFDHRKLTPLGFGPPLLFWLAVLVLTVLGSNDPAASINPFAIDLALALLLLVAFLTARTGQSVRPALLGLVAVAVLLALYGLYQHFIGLAESHQLLFGNRPPVGGVEQDIANRLASHRAFSFFIYPNLFAGFLAMVLPLSAALILSTRRTLLRGLGGASLAILVLALYATQSLGGWVSAAAGMGFFLFWWQRRQPGSQARFWRVWALAGLAAVLGLVLMVLERNPQQLSADFISRLANWGSSLSMAWDHLLHGTGPGLFGTFFPDYQQDAGYYVRYAHNFILQRFAETGLLGLGALGWLLLSLGRRVWGNLSRPLDEQRAALTWALAAGVLAGLLHALVDMDFSFLKTSLVWWFLLGTLLGLSRKREVSAPLPAAPFEALLRLGIAAAGLLVLWRGGKSLLAEGLLFWGTGLLLILFFAFRLGSLNSWGQLARRLPLRGSLALLFVWGTLSTLTSAHPAGAIPGLSLGVVALVFFCLTVLTPRVGSFLIKVLALGSALIAVTALVQVAGQPGVRVAAGWPNPNLLAAFLSMGLLSSLSILLFGTHNLHLRMGAALCALLAFFALLSTGSLGGVLNLLAGLAMLLAWTKLRRPHYFKLALVGIALMGVLIFLLPFPMGGRLVDLGDYRGQAYERVQMAKSALHMVRDRPLLGVGPGNFGKAFERYSFPNIRGLARYGKRANFAHNELLQVSAVIGLPGLALLLWIIWVLVLYFRRQWRALAQGEAAFEAGESMARIAAWAGLTGAAAQALVDFNWHLPALLIWGVILAGIVLSPTWRRRESGWGFFLPLREWPQQLRGLGRQPLVVLLLLTVACAALAGSRPLVGSYLENLGEAYQYKQDLKAADRSFERSLVVHPFSAKVYDRLGQIRTDFYGVLGSNNWYQLAEWAFQRALVLDNLDPYIHRHLGALYALRAVKIPESERARRYDQAERQYRKAIIKAPNTAVLYFELGNLLRDADRLLGAERAWIEALDLEPNYAAALSNLGVAQEMRNDLQKAETSFRRALAIKTLAPGAQGKYELELLSLNWAVVHYNLGHLLERQGRWAEAGAEYQQALTMEPDNLFTRKRLENLRKFLP